jgi:DNA processing protein
LTSGAEGCNHLIRDGALLVRSPADVIDALGRLAVAPPRPAAAANAAPRPAVAAQRPLSETAALHGQILARLGPSPVPEDQLIRDLSLPAAAVAAELVTMELEGRIERQAGGMLARVG